MSPGIVRFDISREIERVYMLPNGQAIKVERPQTLEVDPDGGHVIATVGGGAYIPKYTAITWSKSQDTTIVEQQDVH